MLEEFNRLIPDEKQPPKGRGMTLEEQMSYQAQQEIAAEKPREKYGIEEYDDYW